MSGGGLTETYIIYDLQTTYSQHIPYYLPRVISRYFHVYAIKKTTTLSPVIWPLIYTVSTQVHIYIHYTVLKYLLQYLNIMVAQRLGESNRHGVSLKSKP